MPKSNLSRYGGDKQKKIIYLDYAASISPNPSSIHTLGVKAKKKLEEARREVANILGARPKEIIFTSGGTESNNLAIQGVVLAWHEKNKENILPHIITTNIEHPSVLESYRILERRKLAQISIVPVEKNGIVDPKKIKKEIKKNTVLISVMYANNEIGTIQPIKEIAKEIRYFNKINSKKIIFHTDAVQVASYLDLNVEKLGIDLLSLSGTKIEGSGRVGMLYKKATVTLGNVFGGGDQEMGLRPGTENLPEILKFSTALRVAQKIKEKENRRLIKLRDYFVKKLTIQTSNFQMSGSRPAGYRHLEINGGLQNRLPNNINISFPNIPSDLLVIELSEKGIMTSAKSACKSGESGGSYVIKAICQKPSGELGGVRFSFGKSTTKKDIDYTVKTLMEILKKLKKWYNP
jgi:cysteine desulfurase